MFKVKLPPVGLVPGAVLCVLFFFMFAVVLFSCRLRVEISMLPVCKTHFVIL